MSFVISVPVSGTSPSANALTKNILVAEQADGVVHAVLEVAEAHDVTRRSSRYLGCGLCG